MITKINATNITLDVNAEDPGEGVFSYMIYTADTGMCRRTRYGFWPLCPNQGISIRVSLS